MSFARNVCKNIAASALPLAFATTNANADPLLTTYDPSIGIQAGAQYDRASASKFICLNSNPAKGEVSEACNKPDGHFVAYTATNDAITLIITKDFSTGRGLFAEKLGDKFNVYFIIEKINFDEAGNIRNNAEGKFIIPNWADPKVVAPEANESLAIAHCKKEAGCSYYPNGLAHTYKNGGNYIAGGRIMNNGVKDGNYFLLRATHGYAVVDVVDKQGAYNVESDYINLTGYSSVLQRK